MSGSCAPRARVTEAGAAAERARAVAAAERAQYMADAERKSLDDPDRPRVLQPGQWPEKVVIRIVYPSLPGSIVAEIGSGEADQTSQTMAADDPGTAMAGAEVALAALGYTLDRFRMYQDMGLTVGTFYRKEGL
jgi:hypothetical protein